MTAREYFELPESTGGFVWELHFGDLVQVRIPTKRQYDLQMRIRDLLQRKLGRARWLIEIELPYGLVPDYDVRAADVGVVIRSRWDADPEADCISGLPKLLFR